jgi:adenine-specific DNA-methyltransferase
VLVSFNDEGYLSREQLIELLSTRGEVSVLDFEYARYVGAKIGIHSPSGEKVGKVSHLKNTESLYVVSSLS